MLDLGLMQQDRTWCKGEWSSFFSIENWRAISWLSNSKNKSFCTSKKNTPTKHHGTIDLCFEITHKSKVYWKINQYISELLPVIWMSCPNYKSQGETWHRDTESQHIGMVRIKTLQWWGNCQQCFPQQITGHWHLGAHFQHKQQDPSHWNPYWRAPAI